MENNSIQIEIKVIPASSKNEIIGIRDNRLCIKITAAPEDGKANECLREFLAKTLGCAKRDVVILKGEKSRVKTVGVPVECRELVKNLT